MGIIKRTHGEMVIFGRHSVAKIRFVVPGQVITVAASDRNCGLQEITINLFGSIYQNLLKAEY